MKEVQGNIQFRTNLFKLILPILQIQMLPD